MSFVDELYAQRDALMAELTAVIAAGSSPDYEVHGHKFNWMQYRKYLRQEISDVTKQIGQAEIVCVRS